MDPVKSTHTPSTLERRHAVQSPYPSPRLEKEQPQLPPVAATGAATGPPNPRDAHPLPRKPPPSRTATIDHSGNPRQSTQAPKPETDQKKEIDGLNAVIQQSDTRIKELDAIVHQQDARIAALEAQRRHYESEPYRQEVLSIRVHLQVNDLIEPWEISQKFGEITRQVEDISRNLGEILSSSQPICELKTVDLIKALQHRPHENQPKASAMPAFVLESEDFIDFGCRALLNETLISAFLGSNVFHPALKPEENHLLCETYNKIRRQESQVIAGRWRISTFKSHGEVSYPYKDMSIRFCENILGPFCCRVYAQDVFLKALNSIQPAIAALFERAAEWNSLAKSSVVMLDFHPEFFFPESQWDSQRSTLEGRRPKPPSSKTILLTSKLGLLSSRALGEMKEPEYTLQTKAIVLAAEYFA